MTRRRFDPPAPSRTPIGPDFAFERQRLDEGARVVAGVDEAGRGPLAGPVVAAAVVLDPGALPDGLDDSKKLGARDRERLFDEILATSTVALASVSPAEIDRLNIRRATLLAMRRAVIGLAAEPDHVLIDGIDVPATLASRATAIVGGDARSLSVAAASIVAKVARDRMMVRLCASFPVYGFGRHMGYGTKAHLAAIVAHGPCRHHRRSFAPIRRAGSTAGAAVRSLQAGDAGRINGDADGSR